MKKYVIIGCITLLLLVGAAFWFFTYGMLWMITPRHAFGELAAPSPPDYGQKRFWAALPSEKDEADLVPEGVAPGDNQANAEADVFYIHPTAYFLGDSWNSPMEAGTRAEEFIQYYLSSQASVFNACCRVYAPHYREATIYSFIDEGNDGKQALDLAYRDVATAFDYFLEHFNQGRPFIIASHSQGTAHAMRLIEQRISGTPLRERFIAGYLIGYVLPGDKFERSFKDVPPCADRADTGCIVAWDTFAPDSARADEFLYPYGDGWERRSSGSGVHCTNPLSWKLDGKPADKALNLGAVKVPPLEQGFKIMGREHSGRRITSLPAPLVGHTGARCDNWLIVEKQTDPSFHPVFYDGNYHLHDYSLFYLNLRQNALDRTKAFLERQAARHDSPADASGEGESRDDHSGAAKEQPSK
jgi:hypothetical protein